MGNLSLHGRRNATITSMLLVLKRCAASMRSVRREREVLGRFREVRDNAKYA